MTVLVGLALVGLALILASVLVGFELVLRRLRAIETEMADLQRRGALVRVAKHTDEESPLPIREKLRKLEREHAAPRAAKAD